MLSLVGFKFHVRHKVQSDGGRFTLPSSPKDEDYILITDELDGWIAYTDSLEPNETHYFPEIDFRIAYAEGDLIFIGLATHEICRVV